MDQFDAVIDKELFSHINEEEELIEKLLKCQTYKQFQDEEIDLNSDAAKSIFKCATITYSSSLELREVVDRLPSIVSDAEFI